MSLRTVFSQGGHSFEVSHRHCSELPANREEEALFLEEGAVNPNCFTEISLYRGMDRQGAIHLWWNTDFDLGGAFPFGLLFVEEEKCLWIGAHSASFVVHTGRREKISKTTNDCLFWRFERHEDYVIEYGEGTCFLYNLQGRKIDDCQVEPPYEVERKGEGILFKSASERERWLKFPSVESFLDDMAHKPLDLKPLGGSEKDEKEGDHGEKSDIDPDLERRLRGED